MTKENLIVIRYSLTFSLSFDWPKDADEKLEA